MASRDYEQLFHSAGEDLRRFLSRRITCPQTVSDMIQEAFVKLMGAHPTTELKDARAYLFRIAANLAIDHRTRRREPGLSPTRDASQQDRTPEVRDERTPERVVECNQQLRRVMTAIEALPSRCKEVFILYRFHNMSQAEIAAKLGISVSMVEKHVIRAMHYCREAREQAD